VVWIPGFGKRPDGLQVAPQLDWVPVGSLADYANGVRTCCTACRPGFTMSKAILPNRRLPSAISLHVAARNLTNRHEVSDLETVVNASHPANQEICFSGDGRAIYAGIKRTFKYYREGPGSHPAPSRPKLV
jgi:iron complex outermembrane receptor protein